jgi:ABC-type amino acid transport system permease subunit
VRPDLHQELSYAANLIQSRNFRAFEAFIIATAIYLVLSVARAPAAELAGPALSAVRPLRRTRHGRLLLWDIFRNLLLAARWTVVLSLIAFVGGGLVGWRCWWRGWRRLPWAHRLVAAMCSCSRARRC